MEKQNRSSMIFPERWPNETVEEIIESARKAQERQEKREESHERHRCLNSGMGTDRRKKV